jgi:hypothetical protein
MEPEPQRLEPEEEDMPNGSDIRLKIKAQESAIAELCRKYWLVSSPPHFQYSVEELAEDYGLDVKAIHKVVGQNCTATGEFTQCAVCGVKIVYRNRTTYKQVKSYLLNEWVCRDCYDKRV